MSKRALDLFGSIAGLIILAPLFAILAIVIRAQDGGPVFFAQERVGRGGRRFRMMKFRTMVVDAEARGAQLTVSGDPRITRVGRFLRRSKLDELPQLINVVRGEMSLVGPRPEVPRYVARYTARQRAVLSLKPGITDPASLAYRQEEELLALSAAPETTYVRDVMPAKIRMNLDYAADATLLSDLVVIGRTLLSMFRRGHALGEEPTVAGASRSPAARVTWLMLRHRRWLIVAAHLALFTAGYLLAFALRFEFSIPASQWAVIIFTAPILIGLRMSSFAMYGLFQGYFRHSGIQDLLSLAKATTLGTLAFALVVFLGGPLTAVPRSVLLMEWMAIVLLTGGVRFVVRCIREGEVVLRPRRGKRTLLVGAGEGAEQLIRQLRHNGQARIRIVGLVDDDPRKRHMRLHGVPVLGRPVDLETLVSRHRIQLVVIAIPSATPEQLRKIVEICMRTKTEFKRMPSLDELLDGRVTLDHLQNVEIEHLLHRQPAQFDRAPLLRDLAGQVVLVTGAAGSIGSELARQIASCTPRQLVILDQAESPLYYTEIELRKAFPELDVVPVLASVADRHAVEKVFERHTPAHVFHAAAYKHVPLLEQHVLRAVRNNILGTLCVAECAAKFGAHKMVLISTDKAVNPTSVMGATKQVAERLVLDWPALRNSATDFRAVRFGNVLGTEGSVIPLFRRQLAAGGPLTVTHPDVRRYFMTVPEAVQLVLQASALPEAQRSICMLEMGQPVRILELAENLLRLSGLEPYRDVDIVITGLRPGEKLDEELVASTETASPTEIDKIRVLRRPELTDDSLELLMTRLHAALEAGDDEAARNLLVRLPAGEVHKPRRVRAPEFRSHEHAIPGVASA